MGDGFGFGTRQPDGGADLDGFLTRFRALDGVLDTTGTTAASPSVRFDSYSGGNDQVYGLCFSSATPELVYVVGSTQGYINAPTLTPTVESSDLRGFVACIRTDSLDMDWVQHIEGPTDEGGTLVEAISCVVSDNGQALYVSGNVKTGYTPGAGVTQSQGGSDVFVSKLDLNDAFAGNLLWTRQFGSTANDWVAHRGGLVMLSKNGSSNERVMVVGNTAGAMFQNRDSDDPSYTNIFAVVVRADGTFTPPITPESTTTATIATTSTSTSTTTTTTATSVATTATIPVTITSTTAPGTPEPTNLTSSTPAPSNIEEGTSDSRHQGDMDFTPILLLVAVVVGMLQTR